MQGPGCSIPAGGRAPVRLTVNGRACEAQVESGLLLVDLLRDHLGLKGTHVGCLTGDCGACTVLLDGRSAKACTVLAGSAQGAEVITLEGLGTPAGLHPVQQALWECHGFQCGFCLPGVVFAAVELLEENADPTAAEVKDALSGNLCRCTGYQTQVAAVLAAARRMQE